MKEKTAKLPQRYISQIKNNFNILYGIGIFLHTIPYSKLIGVVTQNFICQIYSIFFYIFYSTFLYILLCILYILIYFINCSRDHDIYIQLR